MDFPKKLMKMQELYQLGFSEHLLRFAARESPMAFKADPAAKNSALLFDTDELSKWMRRKTKATQVMIGEVMK